MEREPHPACPACGSRFARPLPWTARCPACGVSLYVAASRAARDAPAATAAAGGGKRRLFGLAVGVIAMALLAVGWRGGKPPAPAAASAASMATADTRGARQDDLQAQQRRLQEIASCPEGEIATMTAHGPATPAAFARPGTIGFMYNPTLAPEGLPEPVLSEMIRKAASAWSACGIQGVFGGTTQEVDGTGSTVVFQWYNSDGVPTAGYQKGATIYLNHGHFSALRSHSEKYAMDILQTLISHEMGHVFGLREHSARCLDVMATWDAFDKCERAPAANRIIEDKGRRFSMPSHAFPTACDIRRCRMANGVPEKVGAGGTATGTAPRGG